MNVNRGYEKYFNLTEQEIRKLNLIGERFDRLVVIETLSKGGGNLKCLCDCGNYSKTTRAKLIKGHTRSCGCLFKEKRLTAQKQIAAKTKKYEGPKHFIQAWKNMNNRVKSGYCGINESWLDYESFKKDMFDSYEIHVAKHGTHETTLDRIDGNGNYEKNNCRWATHLVQNNNLKTNTIVEYDGMSKTYIEWKAYFNSKLTTDQIKKRVRANGWDIKKACIEPINTKYYAKGAN